VTETDIDLPDLQPPLEDIIKATMCCQFDSSATTVMADSIRVKYGEEYYNKTVHAMSEVIKNFREIIQNSLVLDPEVPAVQTVYIANKGNK
jgi:hypothetical protein